MTAATFRRVEMVFTGSDGDASRNLYRELEALGPAGRVCMNLMRAHKNSARAKLYRGGIQGQGSFRAMAYERKRWAIGELVKALVADDVGLLWGWKHDGENSPRFPHVLFVELPTGQVSFHTESRGPGPDYPVEWDGVRKVGVARLCGFAALILEGQFYGGKNSGGIASRAREVPSADDDARARDGRDDGMHAGATAPPPRNGVPCDGLRPQGDGGERERLREARELDRIANAPDRGAPEATPSNVVKLRRESFDQLTQGWGSDPLLDLIARLELVSEFWNIEGRGSPAEDKIFAAMVKRKIALEAAHGKSP